MALPPILSLTKIAEEISNRFNREHAGFIEPHCIISCDIDVIAYEKTEENGKLTTIVARKFTFLSEDDKLHTVLLPLVLYETKRII